MELRDARGERRFRRCLDKKVSVVAGFWGKIRWAECERRVN